MDGEMGKKDRQEKLLEDYEDVFSDIFNVLVFKGNIIKKEYLKASGTVSLYKAENGDYREQIRDVLKEYNNEFLLNVGFLGIENQSSIDKYIPVRVMGYDYTNYRGQIDREQFPILPVITIVLNFSDKPWDGTKSLIDIMKVPDEFKSYVQDYKVKVFDIAFLEDDIIKNFTSDFRLVANFFKNKRLGRQDSFGTDKITHVQELIDFFAVFTNEKRYKKIKYKLTKMKKKGMVVRMCHIAQALEEEGIKKGIKRGVKQERINRIQSMIKKGKVKEEILDWEYTEEEYAEAESKLLQLV